MKKKINPEATRDEIIGSLMHQYRMAETEKRKQDIHKDMVIILSKKDYKSTWWENLKIAGENLLRSIHILPRYWKKEQSITIQTETGAKL